MQTQTHPCQVWGSALLSGGTELAVSLSCFPPGRELQGPRPHRLPQLPQAETSGLHGPMLDPVWPVPCDLVCGPQCPLLYALSRFELPAGSLVISRDGWPPGLLSNSTKASGQNRVNFSS